MTGFIKSAVIAGLAVVTAASLQFDASAQNSLLGGVGKMGSRKGGSQQPTVITSNSMDIDIGNNVATLIGNVEVDDVEMNIKCHKMIIYLEDLKQVDSDKDKEKVKPEDDADPEKSKQLRKVECIGDVVITRKVKIVDAASAPQAEQKALAGRADYDVVTGKIILSEDPVIFRGKDRIKGGRITIYRESERMMVENGANIETSQSGAEEPGSKPAEKSAKP